MNSWELAEVCRAAGLPEGARPEEIVRAISTAWWAVPWGAAEEERVLLMRAADALNLTPRLQRHRHRLGLVERMVYGALIQKAFAAAPDEQQSALLAVAEGHLEPGQPALAAPPLFSELGPDEQRQLSLQRLVSTGAGLRAVTAALAEVPVRPDECEPRPGPTALFTALASAGPEFWSGRVIEWVRARRGPDLRALFHVLHLCWRQRQRLLVELRAGVAALEDEEKRIMNRIQSLAADRSAARRRLPWHRRPDTGAAVTVGAVAAAAAELVLTGSVHTAVHFALGAGCAWTAVGLAAATRVGSASDRRPLMDGLRRARRQRSALEHQIAQLEE